MTMSSCHAFSRKEKKYYVMKTTIRNISMGTSEEKHVTWGEMQLYMHNLFIYFPEKKILYPPIASHSRLFCRNLVISMMKNIEGFKQRLL